MQKTLKLRYVQLGRSSCSHPVSCLSACPATVESSAPHRPTNVNVELLPHVDPATIESPAPRRPTNVELLPQVGPTTVDSLPHVGPATVESPAPHQPTNINVELLPHVSPPM